MRILIAWELGANFGHLARQLPVARKLRENGFDVVFAVRDVNAAEAVLTPHDFKFLAAPCFTGRARLPYPPANYAELLLTEGYGDRAQLISHVRAWLHIMQLSRADAVIADHAPTTLLAAQVAALPSLVLANGFEIPPAQDPLPSIRPWETIDPNRLLKSEQFACAQINECLRRLGCANELERIVDLFKTSTTLLATFEELDHYGTREGATYIGPMRGSFATVSESWRTDRKKIVAYLRNPSRGIRTVLEAMRNSEAEVICAIPGIGRRQARTLSTDLFRVHERPVELDTLLPVADACVCHASLGMTTQALLSGTSLMLLPTTVEQYLLARRVAEMRAGINCSHARKSEDFAASLRTLLNEQQFSSNAMQFAQRHSSFDAKVVVETVVAKITEMTTQVSRQLH